MDRNYDVITFFLNTLVLMPGVAIFADIIKIATMFIKTIIKDWIFFGSSHFYISYFSETFVVVFFVLFCLSICFSVNFRFTFFPQFYLIT